MDTLKILIPTDFSVQAEYAFVLAKRIEEKIPLEIHFLHVLMESLASPNHKDSI